MGLSIRHKFILITVFITIVLISFSVFLIDLINQLADITLDIIDHPLEVSNAASYANVEVLRMHRDLKEILLVENDYEINILSDKIRVSESNVYIALDTIAYYILGQEGKNLQEEARALFDDWKAIRSEIIDDVRNGRREDALDITRNAGADHIEALERKLLELNQYARKKAVEFQENSIQLEANTERMAVFGILVVLISMTATIYLMSWSVLGGIGSLRRALKDIMTSGEFKNVTLSGNDELTELSKIFNELVSSLGDQLWIREANQELNMLLTTSNKIEETSAIYVKTLMTFGDFLSVAFYHREDNKLKLMSVVNKLNFMDDAYDIGEKHIGECARVKEPNRIVYDENLGIELPYSEIINYPLIYDEEVFGVMCVVFKRPCIEKEADLIYESLKDFSVFVSTYETRRKIDDLLDESIKSNEQLTLRQIKLEENKEELEAANSTLQEQRDLLNEKSNELVKQNKELVNLREELVKKYKDLEEVTQYRSQFLTNISHELRTPLNSVVVLSNMLMDKEASDFGENEMDKIKVIAKASNELLLTINDILDLAKVESGKVELSEEVFEPETLIQELRTIYEPLMNDKGLDCKFVNHVAKSLYGDKAKITHIITNFLSNAIKFTKEGYVHVSIDFSEDIDYPIRIDVTDSGIGIREDKFDDIFTEFVQTDGSISRVYGGTGLGLAICKNYAELINGKINVDSTVGVGSTFSLLLPSACLLDDYSHLEKDKSSTDSKMTLSEGLKNKKILICDDEPMNVFALSAMLEDIGVMPIVALNGDEAVKAFEQTPVDMVLMDYMMPEANGFTVITRLKALKEWRKMPIAIITAANLDSKELKWISNEGYILVRKPIIYNTIVKLLNDNLQGG